MAVFLFFQNLVFFLASTLLQAAPGICAATTTSLTDISTAFSNAGIVPGVIPIFNPSGILDVVFTTQQAVNATPGTNLTVQQTVNEPQFFVTSDDSTAISAQFVVALFDPDAPTPQNTSLAQFRHLLGGGYRWSPNGGNSGILTNGSAALTEFVPPGPPPGSNPHRYMVLLFVQSEDFDSKAPSILNSSTPRTNFNVTAFSDVLGLGAPFAGTFFFTGPDTTISSSVSTTGTGAKPTGPSGSGAVLHHAQLGVAGVFASTLVYLLS
ncbi:phosphatidylethanolamine-binding protein [Mycena rosella]|uniref:Phosphatidylethanolamine-binding protein n=1 Tax=Mycena rosella TaxID=1033263 RepID=A0AAD7CGW3_MYCRO|nr:phosphatidylethanolamine-binding protein [Mycena rosella]